MNDLTVKASDLDIIAPLEQEGTRAVVRTWLKGHGDRVLKEQPVVELETDKVVVELCAPADGVLDIVLQESAEALPGAILGSVRLDAAVPVQAAPPAVQQRSESQAPHHDPQLRLSPAVRRLLSEHPFEPSAIKGTGRGGRLTREDVVRHLAEREEALDAAQPHRSPQSRAEAPAAPAAPAAGAAPMAVADGQPRLGKQIPHDNMRRKIAERMQASVASAPHVTSVFEADFSAIIHHRNQHKQAFAERGVNLTFTAYLVRGCVEAMAAAPAVNSRWNDDFLQLFEDINIGVAAALGDKGLIVPVLHRAQELSLFGIAARLQDLTIAARDGKLTGPQVQGGTFTISNHGTSGSLLAAPIIINQPQSAILGVGAIERRVVVKQLEGADVFVARPKAYVSLTIDHRVLDGSVANAWLRRFVQVLEEWPIE